MTTPLQSAHRAATLELLTVGQDYDTTPTQARIRLARALRSFHKAASRPRKGYCWAWVYSELANARAECLRAGILDRDNEPDIFVELHVQSALDKADAAVVLEARGVADARV